MLGTHANNLKAKAVNTIVEVYDGNNDLIRLIATAKMDGFVDEIDLPDGPQIFNEQIVPIRVKGVETELTEGEGETIFVWDCRNTMGAPVKQGVYRIDIKQTDVLGHINTSSTVISIKEAA